MGALSALNMASAAHHILPFFVSTKKEVLSRHDSSAWFLDSAMTKIMPFSPVALENDV